jgi:hypothetical protein
MVSQFHIKRLLATLTKYSHLHVNVTFILVKHINNLMTTSLLNTSHYF